MEVLEIVKIRVGLASEVRDDFIKTLIEGTRDQLEEINGIILKDTNNAHKLFLADYVAWRYDNQGDDRMPSHLRIRFNELYNMQHIKSDKDDS